MLRRMKHWGRPQKAAPVVTRRVGREKLHFLNAVPDPAYSLPLGGQVRGALGRGAEGVEAELEEKSDGFD